MTLLQFLNVDFHITDVNPIMSGSLKKLTKNNKVPIILYERDKTEFESDPRKIVRYFYVYIVTCRHYIEDVGKQPLSSEETKWIEYIHRNVVPSVTLYNSSSLGNLK